MRHEACAYTYRTQGKLLGGGDAARAEPRVVQAAARVERKEHNMGRSNDTGKIVGVPLEGGSRRERVAWRDERRRGRQLQNEIELTIHADSSSVSAATTGSSRDDPLRLSVAT